MTEDQKAFKRQRAALFADNAKHATDMMLSNDKRQMTQAARYWETVAKDALTNALKHLEMVDAG